MNKLYPLREQVLRVIDFSWTRAGEAVLIQGRDTVARGCRFQFPFQENKVRNTTHRPVIYLDADEVPVFVQFLEEAVALQEDRRSVDRAAEESAISFNSRGSLFGEARIGQRRWRLWLSTSPATQPANTSMNITRARELLSFMRHSQAGMKP